MKEDRRKQSEQSPDQVEFCKHKQYDFDSDYYSFFQENKSYSVKTICIDPLSTRS